MGTAPWLMISSCGVGGEGSGVKNDTYHTDLRLVLFPQQTLALLSLSHYRGRGRGRSGRIFKVYLVDWGSSDFDIFTPSRRGGLILQCVVCVSDPLPACRKVLVREGRVQ